MLNTKQERDSFNKIKFKIVNIENKVMKKKLDGQL